MGTQFAFSTAREDCYADCLLVSLKARTSNEQKIALFGDINFSDGWELLTTTQYCFLKQNWRVKYAIRQGELAFSLTGLKSPLESRRFVERLPNHLKIQQTVSVDNAEGVSSEKTRGKAVTGSIGAKVASEGDISLGLSKSNTKARKDTSNKSETMRREEKIPGRSAVSIHSKGSEEHPVWCFKSAFLRECLQGRFSDKLADLLVYSQPIDIQAKFTTSFQQIEIKEVDTPEFHSRPEKWQIAMTATFRALLHRRFVESEGMAVLHIKGSAP